MNSIQPNAAVLFCATCFLFTRCFLTKVTHMLIAGTVPLEQHTFFHRNSDGRKGSQWLYSSYGLNSYLDANLYFDSIMSLCGLSDYINIWIRKHAKNWIEALSLISVLSFQAFKVMHDLFYITLTAFDDDPISETWVFTQKQNLGQLSAADCRQQSMLVLHDALFYCVPLLSSAALDVHGNNTLQRKVPNKLAFVT